MITDRRHSALMLSALLAAALLSACGGGGGGTASGGAPIAPVDLTQAPGAPAFTGSTALDGYNWINYRRTMLGLSKLARNASIDLAAQGHSDYQRQNNTVTHDQTPGLPGYTGTTLLNRLGKAGYQTPLPYAIGEVISATSNPSGFYQAEELITAIYHRFVMFEPIFKEIGTGAATTSANYTYFTADLTAVGGYGPGLGAGRIANYPIAGQANVPVNFFSDSESPDPVPGQNEVGYPISVHADTIRSGLGVTVSSFTVAPRGGAALAARLLSHANDADTPETAAAIIPLAPLKSATVYDVSFSGVVAGVPVTRNWSFTTR
ncbi:CAP domain-containing protein [Duganella sp. HH105]|uniref:CAP domain-containing protein n=1 Tax=Duganella sp. HH105 TaxID=1781067 RepID=UPI000877B264|nr:CAP domain-containing protein [Duganella sp. HH105]OEZ56258.1 hypothetical protein DUGA6_50380 [Duganella sp. HH105]